MCQEIPRGYSRKRENVKVLTNSGEQRGQDQNEYYINLLLCLNFKDDYVTRWWQRGGGEIMCLQNGWYKVSFKFEIQI